MNHTFNVEFVAAEDFSEIQKTALDRLWQAVYPPDVVANLPGRFFSWSPPQYSILIWDQDEIVSRAGLQARQIYSQGVTKKVGGIGGVMTHPARQGQGLASLAMQEAARRFDTDLNVDYALLFCRPHLYEFYKRLGWKLYLGKVYVDQPDGKIEFTVNSAMLLDVKEPAPLDGEIDLNGLPW